MTARPQTFGNITNLLLALYFALWRLSLAFYYLSYYT
jgi:hypothetical protein